MVKFQAKENVSFERLENGDVLVETRRRVMVDGVERHAIDSEQYPALVWAKIVAMVSGGTDSEDRVREALAFHNTEAPEEPGEPSGGGGAP